jgi:hypothetical protein
MFAAAVGNACSVMHAVDMGTCPISVQPRINTKRWQEEAYHGAVGEDMEAMVLGEEVVGEKAMDVQDVEDMVAAAGHEVDVWEALVR